MVERTLNFSQWEHFPECPWSNNVMNYYVGVLEKRKTGQETSTSLHSSNQMNYIGCIFDFFISLNSAIAAVCDLSYILFCSVRISTWRGFILLMIHRFMAQPSQGLSSMINHSCVVLHSKHSQPPVPQFIWPRSLQSNTSIFAQAFCIIL